MRSIVRRVVVVATTAALLLGGGTAFAETLPANLGNSGDSDRGESGQGEAGPAIGPHVHCVLPALGNGPFEIVVPVSHQAHVTTTNGIIFVANSCP